MRPPPPSAGSLHPPRTRGPHLRLCASTKWPPSSPRSPRPPGGGGRTWGGKVPSPAAPYRAFPPRVPTAPSLPGPAVAVGPFAGPRKAQRGSRDTAGGRHFVSWFLGRALCGSGGETGRGGGGGSSAVPALPHRVALPSRAAAAGGARRRVALGSCGCWRGSARGGGGPGRPGGERAGGPAGGGPGKPGLARCSSVVVFAGVPAHVSRRRAASGEARAAAAPPEAGGSWGPPPSCSSGSPALPCENGFCLLPEIDGGRVSV